MPRGRKEEMELYFRKVIIMSINMVSCNILGPHILPKNQAINSSSEKVRDLPKNCRWLTLYQNVSVIIEYKYNVTIVRGGYPEMMWAMRPSTVNKTKQNKTLARSPQCPQA